MQGTVIGRYTILRLSEQFSEWILQTVRHLRLPTRLHATRAISVQTDGFNYSVCQPCLYVAV